MRNKTSKNVIRLHPPERVEPEFKDVLIALHTVLQGALADGEHDSVRVNRKMQEQVGFIPENIINPISGILSLFCTNIQMAESAKTKNEEIRVLKIKNSHLKNKNEKLRKEILELEKTISEGSNQQNKKEKDEIYWLFWEDWKEQVTKRYGLAPPEQKFSDLLRRR